MHYLLFGASTAHGVGDYEEGGWGTMLRLAVDRESEEDYQHTVSNLSISGDTTKSLLERYEQEAKRRIRDKSKQLFTTLFADVGVNDAKLDKANPQDDIPSVQFKANVEKLVMVGKNLTSRVILVGPWPIIESRTTPFKYELYYLNDRLKANNQVLQEIATKEELTFINLFPVFANQNLEELLPDGLHPNTAGHRLIFEAVKKSL